MRLKPNGSKVRCTKCGNIFTAVPPALVPPASRPRKPISAIAEVTLKKEAPAGSGQESQSERRKHQRITISVPASCISIDSDGNPLDFYIGRITEVSQVGLAIEVFCSSISDFVLVSFINPDNHDHQIKCKVVHSKTSASGKRKIGLSLVGTSQEIASFVAQLVKSHHYSNLN